MKPGKESSSSALGNCEKSKLVTAQKRDARNFVQQLNREWGTRRLRQTQGESEATDRAGGVVLKGWARGQHADTGELEAEGMV